MKRHSLFIIAFLLAAQCLPQTLLEAPGAAIIAKKKVVSGGGGGGDINTSLSTHFKFDENTGITTVDSVAAVTGILGGGTATQWGTPKIGVSSILYTGGGAGVVLGSTITTGTTCSYAAWVFPTSDASLYYCLYSQDSSHAIYLHGEGSGSGVVKLDFYYGADHKSALTMAINTWNHVVVLNNAGAVSYYINNVLDSNTFTSGPGLSIVGLGSDSGTGSEPMLGNVDDQLIYNTRVLDPASINALYLSTTGPTP